MMWFAMLYLCARHGGRSSLQSLPVDIIPNSQKSNLQKKYIKCCFMRASSAKGNSPSSYASNETMSATRLAAVKAGRGSSLLAFYADHHVVPLPFGHRFPMDKYRATRLSLEGDVSLRGLIETYPAPLVSFEELATIHEERYIQSIFNGTVANQEQRAIGFPWSLDLVSRSKAAIGGTVAAMHAVMLNLRKTATNIAGGTHHAFSGHGEGFCVFNDIAVAAAIALKEYKMQGNSLSRILIVDLDVHQGNGTAKIFEKEERVMTFSVQGANNYPWQTRMKSTYDIDLPDGTGDEEYLNVLKKWLPRLFKEHTPGLVFFQAGVDALKDDSFGKLALTRQGLLRRNNMIYSACMEHNLPLVITMGGGYSRPMDASVQAHADVYRSAALRYGCKISTTKAKYYTS